MKDLFVAVAVVLVIGACYTIYKAAHSVDGMQEELAKERYLRMTAEEKLQKSERKLNTLQRQVVESNKKFEKIEEILKHGKVANSNLRSQLNEMSAEKQRLEIKMKDWDIAGDVPALQDSASEY